MGCGSSSTAAVFAETAEEARAKALELDTERNAQKAQEVQAAQVAQELQRVLDKLAFDHDSFDLLQNKDSGDLSIARMLGNVDLFPLKDESSSSQHGTARSAPCNLLGSELKYGINKPATSVEFSDVDSVQKAYQNVTVDRSGALYMAVLGAHWNKFDMYRHGYMSGLPFLCFNNNNAAYVNNNAIPKVIKDSGQQRSRFRSHTLKIADGLTGASADATLEAARCYQQYWAEQDKSDSQVPCTMVPWQNSAEATEAALLGIQEQLGTHILQGAAVNSRSETAPSQSSRRTGTELFSAFAQLWDLVRRDGTELQLEVPAELQSGPAQVGQPAAIRRDEQAELQRFMQSLRPQVEYEYSLGTDTLSAPPEVPFSRIYSSGECEALYLRQDNRLEFVLRRRVNGNDSRKQGEVSDQDDGDHGPGNTGAHMTRRVGIQKTLALSSLPDSTSEERRKARAVRQERYRVSDFEEVRFIQGAQHASWKEDPDAYVVTPKMMRRMREIVRRAAKRNVKYRYACAHAHSAYKDAPPAGTAGTEDTATLSAREGLRGSASLHVDKSVLEAPLSRRSRRTDHSLRMYASMQFFVHNMQQSRQTLEALVELQERQTERAEKTRIRAEKMEKLQAIKAQKAAEKAAKQALLDGKMAAMFSGSGKLGKDRSEENSASNTVQNSEVNSIADSTPPDGLDDLLDEMCVAEGDIGEDRAQGGTGGGHSSADGKVLVAGAGGVQPVRTTTAAAVVTYRQMLSRCSPSDVGHTTFGSGSTWGHLDELIRVALERTEGGVHHAQEEPLLHTHGQPPLPPIREDIEAAPCSTAFSRKFCLLLCRLHKGSELSKERVKALRVRHAAFVSAVQEQEARLLALVNNSESEGRATSCLPAAQYSNLLRQDILFKIVSQACRQVVRAQQEMRGHVLGLFRARSVERAAAASVRGGGGGGGGRAMPPPRVELVTPYRRARRACAKKSPADSSDAPASTPCTCLALSSVLQMSAKMAAPSFKEALALSSKGKSPVFLKAVLSAAPGQAATAADNSGSAAATDAAGSGIAELQIEGPPAGTVDVSMDTGKTVRSAECALTIPVYAQDVIGGCFGRFGYHRTDMYQFRVRVSSSSSDAHAYVPKAVRPPGAGAGAAETDPMRSAAQSRGVWVRKSGSAARVSVARTEGYLADLVPRMQLHGDTAGAGAGEPVPVSVTRMVALVFSDESFAPFVSDPLLYSHHSGVRKEQDSKARGDRSNVHFGVQVTLQLRGDAAASLGSSPRRSRTRRPSAMIRVYARGRTAVAEAAAVDANEEIVMERTVVLDNWKALRAAIPAEDADGSAAIVLDWIMPKQPRKDTEP